MKARREIYARFGVQLRSNRRAFKAERLAPGAMGLYAFCVMDARAELPDLDGFVPEEVVLSAWGRPADERLAQAEALCSVDLLERVDGGFVIVKHGEHNDTKAIAEKNKRDAVKRMRRVRRTSTEHAGGVQRTEGERSPDVPSSSSCSLFNSDLSEGEPKQEGSQARYAEAYARGITKGKGTPYIWPATKYAGWDLGKIIQSHAKDPAGKAYRGDQLLRFIEWQANEFAADVTKQGTSKFYFAFDPRGCLKWLNEDAQAAEARRVG